MIAIIPAKVKRMDLKDILDFSGIAALIAAGIAVWRTIVFRKQEADKVEAEVSDKFQEVASKSATHASALLDRVIKLECEVTELRKEVEAQEIYISTLKDGVRRLLCQLAEAGHQPVWTPPEWTSPRVSAKGGEKGGS